MKGYTLTVIYYTGEIVCDAVCLYPILNVKYWLIPMNKGNIDVIVQLK